MRFREYRDHFNFEKNMHSFAKTVTVSGKQAQFCENKRSFEKETVNSRVTRVSSLNRWRNYGTSPVWVAIFLRYNLGKGVSA